MGNVRLYGATSGYTELAPPAVAPDGVLSLPSGTGTIAKTTDQGLVHINTTTFSAVSSVSLNNVFTSAYDVYRIIFTVTASINNNHIFRLRASGTDASGANTYKGFGFYMTGGTTITGFSDDLDKWYYSISIEKDFAVYDLGNPAKAEQTVMTRGLILQGASNGASGMSGRHTANTAYDGFSLVAASGNLTGIVRVYGYKNS